MSARQQSIISSLSPTWGSRSGVDIRPVLWISAPPRPSHAPPCVQIRARVAGITQSHTTGGQFAQLRKYKLSSSKNLLRMSWHAPGSLASTYNHKSISIDFTFQAIIYIYTSHNIRLSVRAAHTYLEQSIFIYLDQRAIREHSEST